MKVQKQKNQSIRLKQINLERLMSIIDLTFEVAGKSILLGDRCESVKQKCSTMQVLVNTIFKQ